MARIACRIDVTQRGNTAQGSGSTARVPNPRLMTHFFGLRNRHPDLPGSVAYIICGAVLALDHLMLKRHVGGREPHTLHIR